MDFILSYCHGLITSVTYCHCGELELILLFSEISTWRKIVKMAEKIQDGGKNSRWRIKIYLIQIGPFYATLIVC